MQSENMTAFGVWHVYQFVPHLAVLVDQGNQEFHEKAAGTFQKLGSGTANPHAEH